MKILVIDNYDSFTYNLVHYLEQLTKDKVDVYRNDQISLEEVGGYDKILISPGPGIPDEAGITKDILKKYGPTKSIFGVCLGCQAMAEVFGGSISNLNKVYHGVATKVEILDREDPLFKGIKKTIKGGRYHSWIVDKTLPDSLKLTAIDEEGQVMAIAHKEYDVRAVQFHPESVLTEQGLKMIDNWLKI